MDRILDLQTLASDAEEQNADWSTISINCYNTN